ncbi:hypothetical protein I317_04026 [Kwoniella heveanensis CBS 569]|uniref:Transcriptional regulatory protein RXT2 N-terminal domain-containing protein n=1 Tax=Kwoniella heveanensis BCC8398 TaxID=1296120 RepID=A0A1B9GUW5_9TREE|nr:hypothetical protein I316_03371 [Kwoniella heveanensis BCC8398]OCF42174.1 hypothetical protein I317_04026 [Kwoniella heveanensis CBS 569]
MPPQPAHGFSRYAGLSHRSKQPVSKALLDSVPSMDKISYYDTPTSPSSSTDSEDSFVPAPRNILSNSGNKLDPSARFMRRGKMYAWGPQCEDLKADALARKRLKLCLQQLLPDAAAEVGAQPPQNILDAGKQKKTRKRKRAHDDDLLLPHLRSPSPPVSIEQLTPLLALPRTYLDILTSPSMRHTLGDDSMETGLQRTAGELLEGEKPLMQALGRLKDIVRLLSRDVAVAPSHTKAAAAEVMGEVDTEAGLSEMKESLAAGNHRDSSLIPPLPHISDTDNLWRVTQELLGPAPGSSHSLPAPSISYSASEPDKIAPPPPSTSENPVTQPVPTPLQRLFTCPDGITLHATPHPLHPGLRYPKDHSLHPANIRYNLDMTNQCRAVDDALERIAELLADCNEYKERLEEARDRVADVARARKKVWKVVKERGGWELDRKEAGKEV